MNYKERLKEYIGKDEIYQDYKQNKLMNCSDFDKFCIQHCSMGLKIRNMEVLMCL